jgi:Papain family cysteine protease
LSPTGGNKFSSGFKNYPYTAVKGKCNKRAQNLPLTFPRGSFTKLFNNETILVEVVSENPIVAAIHARSPLYQFYSNGIFSDPTSCISTSSGVVNHAVVVVGYGTDQASGKDYWIIRNSWVGLKFC